MTRYVALLRSVNLGPNRVKMADLREAFEAAGFKDPQTIVQTGNVIFESAEPATALEAELEAMLHERFGYGTKVFVRSAAHMAALVAANPYPEMARDDPAHLVAMVMRQAPTPEQLAALRAAIVGRETAEAIGADVYLRYPDNIGDSKLTSGLIERRLGASGTARNWNTVLKVVAALA